MRELERRFPEVLAVVGVHSGKFTAERETARIREASLRLGAVHPTVNDRQFRVWRAYAVRGWPTLVLLDASGRVVGHHTGEFTADAVAPVVHRLVAAARADGTLRPAPQPHAPDPPAVAPGALRHPGKVAAHTGRDGTSWLAVADTGHHRVLVGTLDADARALRVTHVAGDGTAGLRDGALADARFTMPQGLAFEDADGLRLHVADAGNHAVRTIDLAPNGAGTVRTIAGTGARVRTAAERAAGALASPWDVAVHGGTLWVAMAGSHQLQAIDPRTGATRPHAGAGGEDLRDGALGHALLAQPMGIAAHGDALWFADAETSAIRRAGVAATGRVETLVGTGLFDFGDRDGAGDDARLQHPQDVAVHAASGRLLVCDSYNDALKWLDPATRTVTTLARGLHEPGGLALVGRAGEVAIVADTNAHRLARVDLATAAVEAVALGGALADA